MFGRKLCLSFFLFLLSQFAHSQLSNFTLTVTKTDAQCTSSGTLTFAVTGTTPGATMLYSIYLLPNVVPLSVQSTTSISGLAPGNYLVVATQSLGNDNGTQQQNITILDTRIPLTYQVASTPEVCSNDGTVTVSITTGTANGYEILSGPMTRPLQASNTFTGLTAGIYQIRVRDNCNQLVVQTHTLASANTNLNLVLGNPGLGGCNAVNIGFSIQSVVPAPTGVVAYPIQVATTVTPQSGPVLNYTNTVTSGASFTQQVPLFDAQPYNYSFTITDRCGRVYNLSGVIQNIVRGPATYVIRPQDCTRKAIVFNNLGSLTLTSAPVGYTGTVPNDFTPQIINGSVTVSNLVAGNYVFTGTNSCGTPQQFNITIVTDPDTAPPFYTIFNQNCNTASLLIHEITQLVLISCPPAHNVALPQNYTSLINAANYAAFANLPVGTYLFNATDRCGTVVPMMIIINPLSVAPTGSVLEGCEAGFGSAQISGQLVAISLTAAPAAYNASLPVNLVGSVVANGSRLSLDNLPPGTYTFQSTNACSQNFQTSVTILGYTDNTNAVVTPNCGSFNFNLQHASTNNASAGFWLQKYDAVADRWGHPLTPNAFYTEGFAPNGTNSFLLNNNATNFNLAYTGHFRVLKVYNGYVAGQSNPVLCFKVIYEFDFSGNPRINDIYSVSCGTTYEIIVDAEGNSALTYRIISRNSLPFLVENGNSSLFTGLQAGLYVFEVEDACHNTVNGQFEISSPNPMQITANTISCDGESLTMSAPNFSFLTYRWWKGNNTGTVLSTTNSLTFPSFTAATNNGVYHVRITYSGNPNSCLNQVLDYTINISNAAPHAGNDNTASYCGQQGIVDLNTLLSGTFDTNGTWTEVTSSGMLTSNSWDSSTVPYATYQFRYTVSGSCSQTDTAQINIAIKEIPQIPVASADAVICEGQDLNLFASNVANGSYNWTGPNGFTSTVQNPVLTSVSANQNGLYTVSASQNDCQSGTSSVTVLVNPVPVFTLNQDCVEREYQVWATHNETNPDFAWTGPNDFSSNQNPITITGAPTGTYSLTMTNEFGCQATNGIDVVRSVCFVPNVITPNNDESNENLDLTGFGVSKLEIYSRWGQKVYEKSNYLNEWHGQSSNGGILPDSTYYYIIQFTTEETKTGWIFLSRG